MSLTWAHSESDPQVTARAALDAAQGGHWESLDAPTRLRYLRMLLILSMQAGQMTRQWPRPRGPEAPIEYGIFRPTQYRDQESLELASVVLRTPQLVLPSGSYAVRSAKTSDGEIAATEGDSQMFDVGAIPVVIWVLGIAACAIASIVIAQSAGDVVDRQLTRSEDTKRLLASQASAVQVLVAHAEREDKEGRAIPFTDAERAVINSLQGVQMKIAEKRQEPLPTPFAGAANAIGGTAKAIKEGIEELVPYALAAGAAYWLFTRSNST